MTNHQDRPEVRVKPSDYQPSKAEMEETIDMPGADAETIRKAFFQPTSADSKEP